MGEKLVGNDWDTELLFLALTYTYHIHWHYSAKVSEGPTTPHQDFVRFSETYSIQIDLYIEISLQKVHNV
jgi:hypothetical protein